MVLSQSQIFLVFGIILAAAWILTILTALKVYDEGVPAGTSFLAIFFFLSTIKTLII